MRYALLFAVAVVFVSSTVFAQEAPDSSDSHAAASPVRVGVYGDAAGGWTRLAGAASGDVIGSAGAEAAVVFEGVHGIRLGGQTSVLSTLFGTSVTSVDLAYTAQVDTSRRLEGVWGSFGLLVGPTLAFVVCRDTPSNDQTLFGARFGGFADLHLGLFTLGLDAYLRAAVPIAGNDASQWMATVGVHSGFTFELPLSSRHAAAVARADRGGRGSDP